MSRAFRSCWWASDHICKNMHCPQKYVSFAFYAFKCQKYPKHLRYVYAKISSSYAARQGQGAAILPRKSFTFSRGRPWSGTSEWSGDDFAGPGEDPTLSCWPEPGRPNDASSSLCRQPWSAELKRSCSTKPTLASHRDRRRPFDPAGYAEGSPGRSGPTISTSDAGGNMNTRSTIFL